MCLHVKYFYDFVSCGLLLWVSMLGFRLISDFDSCVKIKIYYRIVTILFSDPWLILTLKFAATPSFFFSTNLKILTLIFKIEKNVSSSFGEDWSQKSVMRVGSKLFKTWRKHRKSVFTVSKSNGATLAAVERRDGFLSKLLYSVISIFSSLKFRVMKPTNGENNWQIRAWSFWLAYRSSRFCFVIIL